MIISLFGPDGVGKTTAAEKFKKLKGPDYFVLSGTDIASWPDQSWHDQFESEGIDESTINDSAHFLEKIRRAHALAAELENEHGNVVIDSDPLHKTLMFDMQKPKDTQIGFSEIWQLAEQTQLRQWLHVHVKVSSGIDDQAQAAELQRRITVRNVTSQFDPRSERKSLQMLNASNRIAKRLRKMGQPLLTLYGDELQFPV